MEAYSARQITKQCNHSRGKIYRIINSWLANPPKIDFKNPEKHKHLVFDGTFLHRPVSIVGLMNADNNSIIDGKYGVSEKSVPQLINFFNPLKDQGLNPISCTTDGNPQAIEAIKKTWPNIVIQRCLVHVQRQGLMWCRAKPKRVDAQKLRALFLKITYIKTVKQRDKFNRRIN